MIKILTPTAVTQMPGFDQGLFTVQDLAASKPAAMLDPKPGEKILDICAAPGTKTIQIAELTKDNAEIIATDIDPKRMKMIKQNISRLNVTSIRTIAHADFINAPDQFAPFDRILLDVPCSNTAVLAKRPEARYRITKKGTADLTRTQLGILESVCSLIKSTGRICYSTCSIQPNENKELIDQFLKSHSNFKLESEKLTLPNAVENHDGGYCAVLIAR